MKINGNIAIIIALIITTCLWLISKDDVTTITEFNWQFAGQLTGLLATVLFAFTFILAARLHFIEDMFGGLDKVYWIHHLIGGISFILMLNHPVFIGLSYLKFNNLIVQTFLPSSVLSYNAGLFALYSLFAILFVTFYVKIPYHLWKLTHILTGIPLALCILHVLLISSDVSNNLLLNTWILGLLFLAAIAYIYKRFFYTKFGYMFEYTVEKINSMDNIVEIYLKPKSRHMGFEAGQFIFLRAKSISYEKHPFTISSSPRDEFIRISIKSLGDYTSKMNALNIGDNVEVYGPYGTFGDKYVTSNKNLLWIGGGIGITPFLSMARKELTNEPSNRKIDLFYCTTSVEESVYANEISGISAQKENLKFHQHCSVHKGRIDIKQIQNEIPDLNERVIMLCGPQAMMHSLADQLIFKGIKPQNIIYEDFNFIS